MTKYTEYQGAGVYSLTNQRTGRVYIGSSAHINTRISHHFRDLKKGMHHNKDLQNDYNNRDQFNVSILIKLPCKIPEELTKNEKWFIDKAANEGKDLYNVANLCSNYYSAEHIIHCMADRFCREFFGMPLGIFFHRCEAEYNMMFRILEEPEKEAELRLYYKSAIEYQNLDTAYRNQYGINYADFIDLPLEEQERIKNEKRKYHA